MHIPRAPLWLRLCLTAACIVAFFWLSVEDNHVWPVVLLGSSLTLLGSLQWALSRYGGHTVTSGRGFLGLALFGGIVGAGSSLMTTLLMFFKTAWHSHLYPDYPVPMMTAMLSRMPVWGLAGVLLGLSLALVIWAFRQQENTLQSPT